MRTRLICALTAALLAAVLAAGSGLAAGGPTFTAKLTGTTGSGTATVTVNPGQQTVCYELEVTGIAPATAAHIHAGGAGATGPVVVPFAAPTGGSSSGCVENVDRDLILDIIQHPDQYYVNVHNAQFAGGAIRGQLER